MLQVQILVNEGGMNPWHLEGLFSGGYMYSMYNIYLPVINNTCTTFVVHVVVHGHHRRDGDVYVNQGEEYALRLLELEANFLSIFWIFLI